MIHYFHVDIELLHHHFVKTPSFLHSRAMTPLLKVRWRVALFLSSPSVLLVDLFILSDQNHIIGVTVPWNKSCFWWFGTSQVALEVKGPPANMGHRGSIPRWGISPGGGQGTSLQYSCLENLMDRGAWQTIVHRIATRQTQLERLSMRAHALMVYLLQISRLSFLGCLSLPFTFS